MRHTRNRQRKMLKSNARMGLMTGIKRLGKGNVRIGSMPKWFHCLDYTFEWHREEVIFRGINFGSNWVSFEYKGYLRNIKIK